MTICRFIFARRIFGVTVPGQYRALELWRKTEFAVALAMFPEKAATRTSRSSADFAPQPWLRISQAGLRKLLFSS
jgi:hypothetical protein